MNISIMTTNTLRHDTSYSALTTTNVSYACVWLCAIACLRQNSYSLTLHIS